MSQVAPLVGVHHRTVQDWVAWYRQGGLPAVLSHRHGGHGGRQARLTLEQLTALQAQATAGQIRSIQDGVAWAQREHGITYTYWGMRWVFRRLKLTNKVPRPRSPKASAAEQEAWKKGGLTAQLRAAGCTGARDVYWGDEMRLGLIGQVRRVWAPRGVKVTQAVQFQREWTYLNLAVNGLVGRLAWAWTPNMQAAAIAPVVRQWSTEVATLVWDRARGHRGAAYDDVNVHLIEQPPYSPELNPAERVFEYLRAQVEGVVYEDLEAKKQAVEAELQKLAAAPEAVKRLTGWAWIQESVAALSDPNTVFQ